MSHREVAGVQVDPRLQGGHRALEEEQPTLQEERTHLQDFLFTQLRFEVARRDF